MYYSKLTAPKRARSAHWAHVRELFAGEVHFLGVFAMVIFQILYCTLVTLPQVLSPLVRLDPTWIQTSRRLIRSSEPRVNFSLSPPLHLRQRCK